jgi:sugar lactone lactonase YvrE
MNTNIEELYKKKYLKYKAKYLNIQRGGVFTQGRNHPNHYALSGTLPTSMNVGGTAGFMALDDKGNIAVGDTTNNCVKIFDLKTGVIKKIRGSNKEKKYDNVPPTGIAFDEDKIYIGSNSDYTLFGIYNIDDDKPLENSLTAHVSSVAYNNKYVYILGPKKIFVYQQPTFRHGGFLSYWNPDSTIGEEGKNPGQFTDAKSIAFDREGQIVVADTGNNRIQVVKKKIDDLSSKSNLLTPTDVRCIGRLGNGPGEFNNPTDFAFNVHGQIIVADTGNNRVQILDYKTGTPISYCIVVKPIGIVVDGNGRILVSTQKTIQALAYSYFYKFLPQKPLPAHAPQKPLPALPASSPSPPARHASPPSSAIIKPRQAHYYNGINHQDYVTGEVNINFTRVILKLFYDNSMPSISLNMMALDNSKIFVADIKNKILCIDSILGHNDVEIKVIPEKKEKYSTFGVALHTVYISVSDFDNNRVMIYLKNKKSDMNSLYKLINNIELLAPSGVAFDKDENLVVLCKDKEMGRIVILDGNGTIIRGISNMPNNPGSIAFDKDGNLVVTDSENNCIKIFNYITGTLIRQIGNSTYLKFPKSFTLCNDDNFIIIADSGNSGLVFYNYKDVKFIKKIDLKQFNNDGVNDVKIDMSGNILVSTNNHTIYKLVL